MINSIKGPIAVFFLQTALLLVQNLNGQTSTAQITGLITDPSSAVVAGAKVRVANMDTGGTRDTSTSPSGYYVAPLLDPGRYEISVAVPGFKPVTRSNITLQVDQVARIDFSLEVGEASQSVVVEAHAALLDTSTSSLAAVVENRQITELPTNGRNTLAFVELTPGIRMQGASTTNPYLQSTAGRGNFSANGGVANSNEVLLDGVPLTLGPQNKVAFLPTLDATQEFRVETNTYSAEYGRTGGAVVNLSIKSGTNGFHGTLYEFLRNRDLDANNFFQNKAGLPRPALAFNQFGATVGGPIRHDHTFFFGSYEGFRQRLGVALSTTVPTALQRAGDFSQTFNAAGQLVQIADPGTTVLNANGTYTRNVFPGNRIPASLIDPVAAKFTQFFWPLPNQPGAPFTAVNNWAASKAYPINGNQGVGKLDQILNSKWKLFATFSAFRMDQGIGDFFNNKVWVADMQDALRTYHGVLGATAVLSARWIGEFRSAFLRFQQGRLGSNYPFDLTTLGFPQAAANASWYKTFPSFSITGEVGPSTVGYAHGYANSWNESASMTRIQGNHTLKFGGNYRVMQQNDANGNATPAFAFTGQFTSVNPLAVTATSGVAMGSFLLGYPSSGSLTQTYPLADERWYMDVFLQDDWKVTRRLTLNLGIQYSLDSSITERYNRNAWFDPTAVPPIGQTLGLPLKGALQFGSGSMRTPEDLYMRQWAPRFGFAFQLRHNTVIRGGYGIFWLPDNLAQGGTATRATPWTTSTTFVSSLNGGITPLNTLSNPFPNGVLSPPGSAQGLNSLIGQALDVFQRSNHAGYTQQWNFDIQQDFWKHIVVDIAYAGNRGVALPLTLQLNQLPVSDMSLGTALTQQVPNPFYGYVATGSLASSTVARSQLLLPYPQFTTVQATGSPAGGATYHSMQLKVSRRFGQSLVAASYTVSKGIGDSEGFSPANEIGGYPGGGQLSNNYNRRMDRSLDSFDLPQRFVLSYTLDLPFGKGQRYWSNPGLVNRFVSGWQLSGIYTAQSGTPLFLANATNLCNCGVSFSRPNNNGQSAKLTTDAHTRLNGWFNTSVFSQPPAFTFGNTGRTLPDVRNDSTNNLDFALFKNNRFGRDGRFNLQFRAEAFNVANRVQFSNPGMSYGSAQFGVVSAQANDPRLYQFALKLVY